MMTSKPKIVDLDEDVSNKTARYTIVGGTDDEAACLISGEMCLETTSLGEYHGVVSLPNGLPYPIRFDRESTNTHTKEELKKLSDYTVDEKVAWFDETYNDAMWYLEYLERHGYESKDCEHYTFERCMELLGDHVWKRWNAVYKL